MAKRYHNKKRNSALLYEFLVRHISRCLVEKNQEEANKALTLSKKYFSKGRPLNEELKLFNVAMKTKVKSSHSAQKVLKTLVETSKKLNVRVLDTEKSKLIKEINYNLNKDGSFYNQKVPDYSVYASLHTLLSSARNKKSVIDEVERIKNEDTVYQHLLSEYLSPSEKVQVDKNYNNAVYKFVLERFHKKYNDKLNENQKNLLVNYAEYLISEEKNDNFKNMALKEIKSIKSRLKEVKDDEIKRDPELMSKLGECYKSFVATDFSILTEEKVIKILEYMELVDEVES